MKTTPLSLTHARRIFEYWAHGASYIPIADYRYYRLITNRERTLSLFDFDYALECYTPARSAPALRRYLNAAHTEGHKTSP